MRAPFWSLVVCSAALMVAATTPFQAEARWRGGAGWWGRYGYARLGFWRPGWGAYYPYAPFYTEAMR